MLSSNLDTWYQFFQRFGVFYKDPEQKKTKPKVAMADKFLFDIVHTCKVISFLILPKILQTIVVLFQTILYELKS